MNTVDMQKLDRETAQLELQRWAKLNRRKLVIEGEDEGGVRDRESFKLVLIEAIMEERLTIDDDGVATVLPDDDGEPVVFTNVRASVKLAADKKKEHHHQAKANAILGEMTRQSPQRFGRMHPADAEICESLMALFLT